VHVSSTAEDSTGAWRGRQSVQLDWPATVELEYQAALPGGSGEKAAGGRKEAGSESSERRAAD